MHIRNALGFAVLLAVTLPAAAEGKPDSLAAISVKIVPPHRDAVKPEGFKSFQDRWADRQRTRDARFYKLKRLGKFGL